MINNHERCNEGSCLILGLYLDVSSKMRIDYSELLQGNSADFELIL